jgi:hypothetical protein
VIQSSVRCRSIEACRDDEENVSRMRTASKIRIHAVDQLTAMLLRPSMWGDNGSYEGTLRGQLHNLAFIDEREAELKREFDALEAQGLFTEIGMWGAFAAAFPAQNATDRLASAYARVAARLGYFVPARRLTAPEWRAAQRIEWATKGVVTRADIECRLGPPSYIGSGKWPCVLGYAGPDDDAWLYFDLTPAPVLELTCVRLPRHPFERSLVDLRPRSREATPESAYKEFLLAMLHGDEAQIRSLIVTRTDPSSLWVKPYPKDVAFLLGEQYRDLAVVRVDAPDVVHLASGAGPTLAAERENGVWKIDPEPLLRVRAASDPPAAAAKAPPRRRRH